MATEISELEDQRTPSTAELLSGILDDLHVLVEKQFQLVRTQIAQEVRARLLGVAMMAVGCGILLIALAVLSFGAAHWLNWTLSTIPQTDERLPLWLCEAAVSVLLAIIGAWTLKFGKSRLTK